MIRVKILGTKSPQRYAVRRAVLAAQKSLADDHPGQDLEIAEVRDMQEIQRYTAVFIYPSLVINDKLVCVGRFPKSGEILAWFRQTLQTEAIN
jgi:hypothetical protein